MNTVQYCSKCIYRPPFATQKLITLNMSQSALVAYLLWAGVREKEVWMLEAMLVSSSFLRETNSGLLESSADTQ